MFYFIAYNPVTIKDEFSIEDQLIVPSQVPPSYAYPGLAKQDKRSSASASRITTPES